MSATEEDTQYELNSSQDMDLSNFAESINRAGDSTGQAIVRKIDPLIGTTLDNRYQIIEVLGEGGMSVVYKARQNIVDRFVAVKTLKIQLQTRPVIIERFKREIKSLCKLSHPNIVTVYDIILDQDMQPYVVMDYLTGKSLEDYITRNGPLPLDDARGVLLQIASAVEHAHKNGIVHRDLKPGNAMLIDDTLEYIKVVDFGLAHLGEDNRKLTNSGEVWGSPPYMSPEQCKGEPCDSRADIYSFGAMMYEMLTGKDPFYGASLYELLHKHVKEVPPSMRAANPDVNVPGAIEAIAFKCMEKNPANRYQTMSEVKEALNKAFSTTPSTEVSPATKPMHKYQAQKAQTAERPVRGLRNAPESSRSKVSKVGWIVGLLSVAFIGACAVLITQMRPQQAVSGLNSTNRPSSNASANAGSSPSSTASPPAAGSSKAEPRQNSKPSIPAPSTSSTSSISPSTSTKSKSSNRSRNSQGAHNPVRALHAPSNALSRSSTPTSKTAPHDTTTTTHKPTAMPRKVSSSAAHAETPRTSSQGGSDSDAWAKLRQSRKRDW